MRERTHLDTPIPNELLHRAPELIHIKLRRLISLVRRRQDRRATMTVTVTRTRIGVRVRLEAVVVVVAMRVIVIV